uniref:Uncharacterized protein n=1 Tax=Anguilla anguilla TaxID=7936 RepID=A0A0E9SIL8_ANGAN
MLENRCTPHRRLNTSPTEHNWRSDFSFFWYYFSVLIPPWSFFSFSQ